MTVILVMSTIYFLTWLSPTANLKDVVQSGGAKITGHPVVRVPDIGEDMLAGETPF